MVPIVVLTLLGGYAAAKTLGALLAEAADVVRARRALEWIRDNPDAVFAPAQTPRVYLDALDAEVETTEEGEARFKELKSKFPRVWAKQLGG